MKLDFSISTVTCCSKYKLSDITCETEPCETVACTDGYGIGSNITKYDIGKTRFNVKFPDGTMYNDINIKDFVPATKAYGQFQITGGNEGVIVVDVNGVDVSNSYFFTNIETVVDNLVNTANGKCQTSGWYMEKVNADTVKVISKNPGTTYNGLDVNVGLSGNLTVTMVDDPTAYGVGTDNSVEFEITDLYGTNTPPTGNSGPDFQDGVYEFTYIVYNKSNVEVARKQKCVLFDCNVQKCVKDAIIKLGDDCCSDCHDELAEKVLLIKSKLEQAKAQLEKGLSDCANKTIKSANKICTNICLDC
tara:strand:+ start:8577 stop:9488 length:912 start_codon:yes stop_codon:yes gene_type:complete